MSNIINFPAVRRLKRLGGEVFDDHGRFAVSRVDVNATDTLTSFRIKVQLPHYRRWWTALDRPDGQDTAQGALSGGATDLSGR